MRSIRLVTFAATCALCACQISDPPPPRAPTTEPVVGATPTPGTATSTAAASAAPAATSPTAPEPAPTKTMKSFDEDVAFLNQHGAGLKVLENGSGGRVALSGKYQARIMTSAFEAGGPSLGFVNRAFIEAGKIGTAFDNYGGEDRFWLGPEGGQYALYFAPGQPFEFGNWQTPHSFQEGEWRETASTPSSVVFEHSLTVTNYAKTELKLDVTRKLSLLSADQVKSALGEIPAGVKWVAFASGNTIINRGKQAWTDARGLPSVWILGMFNPASDTQIIAPLAASKVGPVVNDRYFGKIAPDRLKVAADESYVLFKADGQARGKIGLSPARARNVLGSFSKATGVLTIVRFNKPAAATHYVNNLWEISKEPYGGDVSNAYNDGPVEPGKPSLGGFYELESSSPAVALAPGAPLIHVHETYHLSGSFEALSAIALRVLNVNLKDID